MPIYEITADQLRKIEETSFRAAGISERADLQRLLRTQIEVIAPDILVIAEEFGEWEDSHRRIDLLAIDTDANLVVVELKRTEDGGHMELQALRYAAMVSTMTFDRAVETYAEYLMKLGAEDDARSALLEFLEWEEPDEDHFAQDVRIVLVSAEFSKELTTAVLWLNDHGLDIRCVRLKPYRDQNRTLIDVQQVIPLPEATEYQVQVSVKNRKERIARATSFDFTKYDVSLNGVEHLNLPKRRAIFQIAKYLCSKGIAPEEIAKVILWRSQQRLFCSAEGHLAPDEFIAAVSEQREADGKRFDPRRWFHDDDELIYVGNQTYCFTNQWGTRTLEAIDLLIKTFSEHQISYQVSKSD